MNINMKDKKVLWGTIGVVGAISLLFLYEKINKNVLSAVFLFAGLAGAFAIVAYLQDSKRNTSKDMSIEAIDACKNYMRTLFKEEIDLVGSDSHFGFQKTDDPNDQGIWAGVFRVVSNSRDQRHPQYSTVKLAYDFNRKSVLWGDFNPSVRERENAFENIDPVKNRHVFNPYDKKPFINIAYDNKKDDDEKEDVKK